MRNKSTALSPINWLEYYLLHVEERVEQRVNELRRKHHEAREVLLERVIDIFVFICGNLEILFKLPSMSATTLYKIYLPTLNKFFSSLSDLSFLSLSFVSELLKRS